MAYPLERKEAILNKLLPPSSKAIAEVAKEEGIPIGTIYAWQSKTKQASKQEYPCQEIIPKQITGQQRPNYQLWSKQPSYQSQISVNIAEKKVSILNRLNNGKTSV